MDSQEIPPEQDSGIPDDATVVRQIQYAWLWSSAPWLAALGALFFFGLIPDPFVSSLIALIILVPRYIGHRRTAYIITEDSLVYRRGGLMGSQSYSIPIERLRDIKDRYGMFGRTLGYETVDIMLDNGTLASLSYVPLVDKVSQRLRELMDASASGEGRPTDEPHERPGPSTYDPEAKPFDPDESSEDKPRAD